MSITQLGLTGTPSKQYSVTPKRAATTITKTIGTSSRDYSTITAWDADLDNTLVYVSGDDAVGECYNDSTFDESVTIDGGLTVGLNTFTLTAATGEQHDGTEGTGVRIVNATNPTITLSVSSLWDAKFCTISDIEIDRNGYGIANGRLMVSATDRCYLFRMLLHGSLDTGNGNGSCVSGFEKFSAVSNNIIYDLKSTASNDEKITGIGMGRSGFTSYCYNNTVFDLNTTSTDAGCVIIGIKNVGGSVSNNISMDCTSGGGSADDFTNIQTGNNLSSDSTASGTGSLTNKTAANQFVSTVGGSEDLHLKAGADAIGAGVDLGTTPDGVQYDIDGVDRDARGTTWDIGADQAAGTVGKTIGTAARDYSTMTLWEADLDDSTVYQSGDDAVGECYNDSDFTETITVSGGSAVGLTSVALTAASTERHNGTAGTGVRVLGAYQASVSGTDTIQRRIEWIEYDYNGNGSASFVVSVAGFGNPGNATVSQLIVHDAQNSVSTCSGIKTGDNDGDILNCIIYDIRCSNSFSAGALGVFCSIFGYDYNILNCTVYNMINDNGSGSALCYSGLDDDFSKTMKNCIGMGVGGTSSGTKECFASTTTVNADYSHNLSSDTSAPGASSVTNSVTADQFVSIVSGSEDLHLKSGSDAIGAGVDLGTTPDGVQYDIDGVDRDARGTTWDIGADQAAGTVGKTIGTAARDYSTMTLWEADLDDSTVYQSGDDAVGECYNDSTFDESVTINNAPDSVGLGDVTLTVADGERHDGTEGTGARIVRTSGGSASISQTLKPQLGTMTIEWLEIDHNGNNDGGLGAVYLSGSGGTTSTYRVAKNLIVHGVNGSGRCTGIYSGISGGTGYIFNCFVYDISATFDDTIYAGAGIYSILDTETYNCSVLNTDRGVVLSGANVITNNVISCDASDDDDFVLSGTYSHLLSSDTSATGTGSLISKASSDQFVSTVSGSEDLHLKAGSDAIGAGVDLGTTPDGVQYDIDGVDRDARGSTWDIGADQAAGTVGKTIGTAARDYSTMTLWEADLDDSTFYQSGDDAVGECYNDSTFDETVTINGGSTVGLNSCTLTVADGEKHDGTAGNGVRIVRTANSSNIINNTGSTQTEISWLEIDANGFNATGVCRGETGSTTSSRLKNLIAHGQSGTSSFNGFLLNRGSSYCLNNILYDCINTLSGGGGNGFKSGSSAENWHNNTCYLVKSGVSHTSGSFYGMNFASITASNNISVDSGTDGTATGADFTGTSDYSLSSDSSASGTSVLTNKTSANQFVSTVGGSEDLHLKAGSDAIGAGVDLGTTPTGVNIDINGFDRDSIGVTWDIGAHQFTTTLSNISNALIAFFLDF